MKKRGYNQRMSVPKISVFSIKSLFRALSHPPSLRAKRLGPNLREKIILRVSSINQCNVCSVFHENLARWEGLSRQDIAEARNPDSDDEQDGDTRLLFHYAEIRTSNLEKEFPEVVQAFEQAFDEATQREVRAIVDLFTFNNRFNNSWEGWLPGAKRRRQSMGLTGPRVDHTQRTSAKP